MVHCEFSRKDWMFPLVPTPNHAFLSFFGGVNSGCGRFGCYNVYSAIVENLETCCKEVVDGCPVSQWGDLTYKTDRHGTSLECVCECVFVTVRGGKAALLCTICQI